MNGRVIAAILAAVLAILGIGATVLYAAGANARAFDGATLKSVYVVKSDVPADADTAALGGKVELVKLPSKTVAVDAVTDLSQIEGKRSTVPLVTGEQLLKSRFSEGGSSSASGSTDVPKGMQEISIQLDPANAGGSTVKPGTKVGLIVTATGGDDKEPTSRMFLQGVQVTSVEGPEAGGIVSLAVNGQQATQIAAAAQVGTIRLTAQNQDTEKDGGSPVTQGSLIK